MPQNILEDQTEDEFAQTYALNRATVRRYRCEPDGLPYTRFGGRIFIHVTGAREWLARRTRIHNPRRAVTHLGAGVL